MMIGNHTKANYTDLQLSSYFFFLTMFKINFVRVTCSTFQKALSHRNNLMKEFFSLSFPEDEVTSDQEIIDVSLPV